jgi:hypothetical protein
MLTEEELNLLCKLLKDDFPGIESLVVPRVDPNLFLSGNCGLSLLIDCVAKQAGKKFKFELKYTFLGEWFCEVQVAAWCKGRAVEPYKNIAVCKAICEAIRLAEENDSNDTGPG